jgi:hypothetical protein
MKSQKQIKERLDALKRNQQNYGNLIVRQTAIKVLEWVLQDEIEMEVNA